ncbi:hypothetical protein AAG906_040771 [Vitis piasezkii]
MKLNPTKYAFNVNARKFLWFMVTQRGIEVNSAQVKLDTFPIGVSANSCPLNGP